MEVLKQRKEAILAQTDYLNLTLVELQDKLDTIRPELVELRKKRENYHMWLLQRGENDDKIQTVIEPARLATQTLQHTKNSAHSNAEAGLTKLNNELFGNQQSRDAQQQHQHRIGPPTSSKRSALQTLTTAAFNYGRIKSSSSMGRPGSPAVMRTRPTGSGPTSHATRLSSCCALARPTPIWCAAACIRHASTSLVWYAPATA